MHLDQVIPGVHLGELVERFNSNSLEKLCGCASKKLVDGGTAEVGGLFG